jgi:redox-sensitive bicupin YhaK (pirin superfamily)
MITFVALLYLMITNRSITSINKLQIELRRKGFMEGSFGGNDAVQLDPFLMLTDFRMSEPIFAPHPHAGYSAVTYMFRDSPGSFTNRDSFGDYSIISPGSLHWTQAASGMMHEEIPVKRGIDCHGLQMFVNLSNEHKKYEPKALHIDSTNVPVVVDESGATVRVVVGSSHGVESPLTGLLKPISLIDVDVPAGTSTKFTIPAVDRAIVLVVNGDVDVNGSKLTAHDIVTLDPGSEQLIVGGIGNAGGTALVLWGTPINEPVLWGGGFVMAKADDLVTAKQKYQSGGMGTLAPSF